MKKFLIFCAIFLTWLFLKPQKVFGGHACNEFCYGATTISCSETTGQLTYNQGSCNSGLACDSSNGNICRNPYCPTRNDCTCPNFTIQGYKRPNQSPFSTVTVYLDSSNQTTAQPYYFNKVSSSPIHRVYVSTLPGSAIGYTLCYNNTNCHTNTPTNGNSVYICSNKAINSSTNYADLWWHFTPQTANVSNVSGPLTIFVGDTVSYSATFSNGAGTFSSGRLYSYTNSCLGNQIGSTVTTTGTHNFNFTPTSIGNYILYGRADSTYPATCIGYQPCVGSPPNYLCAGPNSSLSVAVQNPGPWYKLKDASLNKIGDHNISVVQNIKQFDTIDDNTTRRVIISTPNSNPGLIITTSNYNPGPSYNPIPGNTNNVSTDKYTQNYSFNNQWINNFYQYVTSRKSVKKITNINEITSNGLYYINSDNLSISTAANYNFVLIIRNNNNSGYGNLTINTNNFNSAEKSIFFIANNITFGNGVQIAKGIFIAANQISYLNSDGLKIVGNLVSQKAITLKSRSDNTYPSLFIVFKPQMYLDLLPYLSIAKYDWRQLQ